MVGAKATVSAAQQKKVYFKCSGSLGKAVSIVEMKREGKPELTFFCSPMSGAPGRVGGCRKERTYRADWP